MKNYELTIVLDGKASSAKKKAVQEKATAMVAAFRGKVGKTEDWGERELAYKIGKSESGHYIFMGLEMEAAGAKNLNDKLRLEEDLIRYLLVSVK